MITTLASANAEQPSVVEVAWDEDVEFSLWLLGWDEEAFIREEDSVSEVPFFAHSVAMPRKPDYAVLGICLAGLTRQGRACTFRTFFERI